jgi:catechol 2,3-dioxygenase-like lactoylglutathione lyase family enzyme
MDAPLTLGPIGQIARSVKDIAAARAWYGDVLGLRHLYSFGNLAFYDCGGVRLFLSEGEATPSESILYFRVPDIRSAHHAMIQRGVEWMAFLTDNEGRALAIMAQVRSS